MSQSEISLVTILSCLFVHCYDAEQYAGDREVDEGHLVLVDNESMARLCCSNKVWGFRQAENTLFEVWENGIVYSHGLELLLLSSFLLALITSYVHLWSNE